MGTKNSSTERAKDTMSTASFEDVLSVFLRWRREADKRRAQSGEEDPTLPRVPFKVQQIKPSGANDVAHFHRHYKNPSEVIGTLTLVRPDLNSETRKQKTKKPS